MASCAAADSAVHNLLSRISSLALAQALLEISCDFPKSIDFDNLSLKRSSVGATQVQKYNTQTDQTANIETNQKFEQLTDSCDPNR